MCDGYVTLTDGSGIVHIAPAFGEDDYRVGRKYELPVVNLVDERGCFVPAAKDLAGVFVKKGDKTVIAMLKDKGLLFKEMSIRAQLSPSAGAATRRSCIMRAKVGLSK